MSETFDPKKAALRRTSKPMKSQTKIEFIKPEGTFIADVSWHTSRIDGVKPKLDKAANTFTLIKTKAEHIYLTCGCKSYEFTQLKHSTGLAITAAKMLLITTNVKTTDNLNATLKLLEYDEDRMRIGTRNFPVDSVNEYRPSPGTQFVAFTFRLEGEGEFIISKLHCEAAQVQTCGSIRSSTKPSAPAPVQLTESQRIQVFMESVQNEITRTVASLEAGAAKEAIVNKPDLDTESKEAYKWKRRAVDWEKKANKANEVSISMASFLHDTLLRFAKALPDSNGTRYYEKFPYKVAIITDIYMYNFYKDVFETVTYLPTSTYQEILKETDFDLMIYVTCWRGIQDDEWRGVTFREKPMVALNDILEHCKINDIPTVFQSIEDPSNFDYFLPLATKFDIVLTSDIGVIENYKSKCGHQRVFYGEYGANPNLNNPIASMRPALNAAFFAGSYPERYPERCQDMCTLFDSILEHGANLLIADRNFESSDFNYPAVYNGRILPQFEHSTLQKVHKLFRYSLNFNSIKNSATMCAMRVYELQAQGRTLLSNYSKSVFNNFPEVRIVPYLEDLSGYFESPETLEEQRSNMERVRNIMSTRTSFDVVGRILMHLGLEPTKKRPVGVLVIVDTLEGTAACCFKSQSYPQKVMLGRNDLPREEAWSAFIEKNDIGYVTVFAEDQIYERYYLEDMMNGFKYTDSDYITMDAWFDGAKLIKGKSHEYTDVMPANWRSVFSVRTSQNHVRTGEDILNFEGPMIMENGYSIDPFQLNYMVSRAVHHDPSIDSPRLSVIVPVFNNGRFLLTKCIPSLQRNSLWPRMEVLLIDDGSTDDETLEIVASLELQHTNITSYRFDRGGSGSASRPRNKGITIARSDLITFLDPDNEIASGGYDTLVALFDEVSQEHAELGFVSGFQVKVNETSKVIGRHTAERVSVVTDLNSHFFQNAKFPVISTQCAVIHRSIFEKFNLHFIERAAGQDTLFGWELAACAAVGAFTDQAHLIYYAERVGSVTNSIDAEYFRKKTIMEKAQIQVLERHNLLDIYTNRRLDFFIREWYLKKLELVAKDDRPECEEMLKDIIQMYGGDPKTYGLADQCSADVAGTAPSDRIFSSQPDTNRSELD